MSIFRMPLTAVGLPKNSEVIVPLDGRAHLPGSVRQWMGDSRGRWEGNTLVIDTTNFTDKTASFSLTKAAQDLCLK